MDNLLLAFPYKVDNIEEWNNIINKFDEENYYVYLFQDIHTVEFDVDRLSSVVEYYRNIHKDINKIVVISSARDLVFSWYRCYNAIVDDFIYFIDKDEKKYYKFDDDLFPFIDMLTKFINIDKEKIEGKIFININNYNYTKISTFLLENNKFKYFDFIDNYNFAKKHDIIKKSKKYTFNDNVYSFDSYYSEYDIVSLKEYTVNKINIDKKFSSSLKENIYFIKYVLIELYKLKNNIQVNSYLEKFFMEIGEELALEQREKILDMIIKYTDMDEKSFEEKVYMLSLCVLLKSQRSILCKKMVDVLSRDNNEDSLEYHFHMLFNIFAFQWNENLKLDNKVYIEIRKEIVKLGEFFLKKGKININKELRKDDKFRIAIHYDQLLSVQHGPTLLALEMAKNLIMYYKNCEVKIFVEDNFIVSQNEMVFSYAYSSVESLKGKKIHEEYLKDYNIEIYYSNPYKNKIERTKEIIEEINRFNPDIIYSTSDLSIAREILYNHYPIIYQTHGGTNFSTLCDIYVLYGNSQKEKLLQINDEIKLIDESKIIINEQPGFLKKQFKKDYKKVDLGLNKNSFVMVTVGNRLNTEMSDEFVDLIISFIIEKDNAVWILVGPKEIPYIIRKYKDLISKRKIIKIDYEEDLLALYKICDVYINPIRNGGAGSILIAMQCGIPSIVEKTSQDSVFVIGEENCVENDKEAYIGELMNLYEDKDYKKYKSELMKKIIENKNSWEDYIKRYIDIFNLAKEKYYNRINN